MDQEVQNLSGGELQRVAITLALGQPADLYLIDEPSAYLDSEQRIMAAKVGDSARQGCYPAITVATQLTQPPFFCLGLCFILFPLRLLRSLSASSCTRRRLPSSWSTISSWPPTWRTVSSCTRESRQNAPSRALRRACRRVRRRQLPPA